MTEPILEHLRIAVEAAQDKKAEEIAVLDLQGMNGVTDHFLICHGNSPRQVHAIVDSIMAKLRDAKLRPAHIEGENGAEWVLMDYLDFVVHVFVRDRRTFYSLDKLWAGAPRIEFPVPTATAVPANQRPGA